MRESLVSTCLFSEFKEDTFKFGLYSHIPKAFHDLVHDVNNEIVICVSPETKWIIETGHSLRLRFLQTGKLKHTISKFNRFSFTNDDHYLVYSCEGSLYALSLQTDTILKSISGCTPYCFTSDSKVGYWFRSDTDEKVIFLTNLFSPFKFLPVDSVKNSVVGNSIAATFRSSDTATVLSVSPDSMVTLWQVTTSTGKEVIAFVSGPSFDLPELHVKKCVISPDGKVIASHQGSMVQLYSFSESGVKFLDTVFKSGCEFTVACFAFSSDTTLLLFYIQDDRYNPDLVYVWHIQKRVVSASFQSRVLFSVDCCCLSNRELILCGEYQIEIWKYAEHNCSFLRRLGVERPYKSVKFKQCTVSSDNQFLACCIADVILVYSLHSSDINSSEQVLRGHLGSIEFCRFLKVNRYLISYGVDGMVFLWDLADWRAVGFARIAQGQDSIVSMAVSPEEERAVCFTSSCHVCLIKLCNLDTALSLKPVMPPVNGQLATDTTSQQIPVDNPSTSQVFTSTEHEGDTTESLSGSDSDEGYYLEDLDDSD